MQLAPGWPPHDDYWYAVWFYNPSGIGLHHIPMIMMWCPREGEFTDRKDKRINKRWRAAYHQRLIEPPSIQLSRKNAEEHLADLEQLNDVEA